MEQQGEGLEEWSGAAGEDDAAAEYEVSAGYEVDEMAADYRAAEVDDLAGEDVSAAGWELPADTGAGADAGAVWDTQEDAETVAWDEGEDGVLGPDGPGGRRPATGEPRVDAAMARLDELTGRPLTEHRAIFEDVHRRLRDVLGELDTREQGSGGPAAAAGAERRAGR